MIHTLIICIAIGLFIGASAVPNDRIGWAGMAVLAASFLPL